MGEERERFEGLFRAHYADVTRYAVRRVGADTSHEVVAETFLVAWRRLDDVPEAALPWLYAVARRIVANEMRRRHRAHRLDQRVATAGATGSVDTGDIGEVVAERVRVRAALGRLSERDREVIRLTHWEQLDLASAAQVLECSVTACKVRLHRARRRLAALLDTSSDPEIDNLVRQGETP